jgi:hypothetical protein
MGWEEVEAKGEIRVSKGSRWDCEMGRSGRRWEEWLLTGGRRLE